MLTCREVTERSSALIDGELGHWARIRVILHLAICRPCRNFIAGMRRLRSVLARSVRCTALEPGFTDDVMHRLAESQPTDIAPGAHDDF